MKAKSYSTLVSTRQRRSLARSLDGVVRSLDPRLLPGASPLNRRGLWLYEPELRTLASRVSDFDRPVSSHGLKLVQNLLVDAGGPLYDRDRVDELPDTVKRILVALETG